MQEDDINFHAKSGNDLALKCENKFDFDNRTEL